MTIKEQIHGSKLHRDGFDPNCAQCLADKGVEGIIAHLEGGAEQNEKDCAAACRFEPSLSTAAIFHDIAAEQRRMIGILRLYQRVAALGGDTWKRNVS